MQWTFHDDRHNGNDRSKQWMFEVSLGDISVVRRYPVVPSAAEADDEANRIAPELFHGAETWLK